MLYEFRRYEVAPGKLPEVHRRFADVSLKFWEKHGIRVIAFWEAVVGTSNELYYLLQWRDMAERESKWDAFQSDREWQAARTESEKNGPLVLRITNSFLKPTSYSPMK
jgi:hypothetical protein